MLMTLLVCLFAFALPTYADAHSSDHVTLSPTVGCPGCHVDAVRAPTIASDLSGALDPTAVPAGDHALDGTVSPMHFDATPEQRLPVAPDLARRPMGYEPTAMASDPERWTLPRSRRTQRHVN